MLLQSFQPRKKPDTSEESIVHLTESEIEAVMFSLVRKGKEAAAEFRGGGREDLALKEDQEVEIMSAYLPKQLSMEEIEGVAKEVVEALSAKGSKDLGRVMKAVMTRVSGQADGKKVNEVVRRLLG